MIKQAITITTQAKTTQVKLAYKQDKQGFWALAFCLLLCSSPAHATQSPSWLSWLFGQKGSDQTYADQTYNANSYHNNAHDGRAYTDIEQGSEVLSYQHSFGQAMPTNTQMELAVGTPDDFYAWQQANPHQIAAIQAYERYLYDVLGASVPPMNELSTTARSWRTCGHQPYEVPPQNLWANIIPTLKLYQRLKALGILPKHTKIRSVYRNFELNRCAGGASASSHLKNSAIDIWVPEYEYDKEQLHNAKDALCRFWLEEGRDYNFGLGLYATEAIHIDTNGYRKWGGQYSRTNSPCRL